MGVCSDVRSADTFFGVRAAGGFRRLQCCTGAASAGVAFSRISLAARSRAISASSNSNSRSVGRRSGAVFQVAWPLPICRSLQTFTRLRCALGIVLSPSATNRAGCVLRRRARLNCSRKLKASSKATSIPIVTSLRKVSCRATASRACLYSPTCQEDGSAGAAKLLDGLGEGRSEACRSLLSQMKDIWL